MRAIVLATVLALVLVTAAGAPADTMTTDYSGPVAIQVTGVQPFIWSGNTYVPLKSATDFLGAAVKWDSARNCTVVSYNGYDLALTIGTTTAYYGERGVTLPAPPIIYRGQMLVPVELFDRYFEVPVDWHEGESRVYVQGPPGWGYYQVMSEPPDYIVAVFRGYGFGARYDTVVYAPAPFVYYNTTYLPLRDVSSFVGAALLWDDLYNRCMVTYNGHEFGLIIGSPWVYYGGQVLVLSAPPVLVGGVIYIPLDFCERHFGCHFERHDRDLRIRGPRGWHDFRLVSRPPRPVYGFDDRDRDRERERDNDRDRPRVLPVFDRTPRQWNPTLERVQRRPTTDSGQSHVGFPTDRTTTSRVSTYTNRAESPALRTGATPVWQNRTIEQRPAATTTSPGAQTQINRTSTGMNSGQGNAPGAAPQSTTRATWMNRADERKAATTSPARVETRTNAGNQVQRSAPATKPPAKDKDKDKEKEKSKEQAKGGWFKAAGRK